MTTETSPSPHVSRGYTIALIAAVILSTTAIFIRYLTQNYELPALTLAFWRDVFVVLTLVPALLVIKPVLLRGARKHLRFLALYGLALAGFNALWTLSVALNGAAIATVLVYCSTAFTALLGRWFLKERLDWTKWVAIALTLGGCIPVSGLLDQTHLSANLPGILTGVLAGLLYALYSLLGRSASQRGLSPWTTLVYIFGFAALFLLAANLFPSSIIPGSAGSLSALAWKEGTLAGWGILFLLAAGPTVAGFGLYLVSLTYLPSSVANLIVTMEPVFTAITAYILLGERLTLGQIGGSLMILAGVVFLRIVEGRRTAALAQASAEA